MHSSTAMGSFVRKRRTKCFSYISQPQSERYDQTPAPVRCGEVVSLIARFRRHFFGVQCYSSVDLYVYARSLCCFFGRANLSITHERRLCCILSPHLGSLSARAGGGGFCCLPIQNAYFTFGDSCECKKRADGGPAMRCFVQVA